MIASTTIESFGDKRTKALFDDEAVPALRAIARQPKRKLELIEAANSLDDLRFPPSNRLEKFKGHLQEFYSIRINDQWRVIFSLERWWRL